MEIILIMKFQTIEDDFDPLSLRKIIAFFAGKAVLFSSTRKTLFFCWRCKIKSSMHQGLLLSFLSPTPASDAL